MTTAHMLFEEISCVDNQKIGKIILNRPQALNALTHDMFSDFRRQLEKWEQDKKIKAVIIRSNCEKAFCAGGDIRSVYENRQMGAETLMSFFKLEYDTNRYLYHYPKPYIAFLHGITMGGGVGISLNGKYTLAVDNLRWAMPETLIGFFPDVGASYYLSRMDAVGKYLALTGNSINAADAKKLNIVQHVVSSDQLNVIEMQLLENDVDSVWRSISTVSVTPSLDDAQIEKHFSFDDIEAILSSLKKENNDWAKLTYQSLLNRSPTSVKVALMQLQYAKQKTLDGVIQMDLKIAHQMLKSHDFYEGIRAAVIDKDKNPQWRPAQFSEISADDLAHYF
jgi:enoyl-CoA hydratase